MVNYMQAAAAVLNSLTTPDSEDWTVLCNHDTVHLTVAWEEGEPRRAYFQYGAMPLRDFKATVSAMPAEHGIGLVLVIIPTDGEITGSTELLSWLATKAREKNFSIASSIGMVDTVQAVAALEEAIKARASGKGER